MPKPKSQHLTDLMKANLRTYALYATEERAIPDIRDGLKPVQRRVLFTAFKLSLKPGGNHRKVAKISGDCLGNYHPHSEPSITGALVNLARPFSTRYPLLNGKGNFGSEAGDRPAASRYIEAKLSPLGWAAFNDIDYILHAANYDGTLQEPTVLPSPLPFLVLNGYKGIAVGIAGSVPPHNLIEVAGVLKAIIKNPKLTVKKMLREYLKGPDFPTGTILINPGDLEELYEKGRGTVHLSARYAYEEDGQGQKCLVVTQFPPGMELNKWQARDEVRQLVEDGSITLLDQGKANIRLVIYADDPRVLVTQVEPLLNDYPIPFDFTIFDRSEEREEGGAARISHVNFLDLLHQWLDFRCKTISDRTKDQIARTEWEIAKVEALRLIIANKNAVIEATKKDKSYFLRVLMRLGMTQKQAEYVGDSKIVSLASKNDDALKTKLGELCKELDKFKTAFFDVDKVIVKELNALARSMGDDRRTSLLGVDTVRSSQKIVGSEYLVTLDGKGVLDSRRGIRKGKTNSWITAALCSEFISVVLTDGRVEQYHPHSVPATIHARKAKPLCLLNESHSHLVLVDIAGLLCVKPHENHIEVGTSVRLYRRRVCLACGLVADSVLLLRYSDQSCSFLPFAWLIEHRLQEIIAPGWPHVIGSGRDKAVITEMIPIYPGCQLYGATGQRIQIVKNLLTRGNEPKIIPAWKYRRHRLFVVSSTRNFVVMNDGNFETVEDLESVKKQGISCVVPLDWKGRT